MSDIVHLDYETTSKCDIKLGGYRYACDESSRILMFAVSVNDDAPLAWDFTNPESKESKEALATLDEATMDPGVLIYAHNAPFEIAVSTYRMKPDLGLILPTIEQWRCTMAMCRRAGVPPSLKEAANFLNLGQDKDKRGKALINIFSDQNKLVTIHKGKEKLKVASPILENPIPWDWSMTVAGETLTVRDAWDQFLAYCRQDTVVEKAIHKALRKFELEGEELAGFLFDLRMNARGVPVNMPALLHAQSLVDEHREALETEFHEITGLQPTQTAKTLQWLRERGYKGENLQASTMDDFLAAGTGMDHYGLRALQIRADLSFAAVKKIPTMISIACPDNRIRGQFTWYGAQKTGRWTSQGSQLHNAKKPTIKNHAEAYKDICDGIPLELMSFFYGNPYEAVASCVRNFVKPHAGQMLDADYSNIESRVAALIAGQESMLQAYRDGRDLYKELASIIFNVPIDKVTKDQRFVAKTASLACIYQTGAKTFHETCAMWGMPIEKKLACHTVRIFRETNEQFPITWRAFERAATKAIQTPGTWFEANQWVSFASTNKAPFARLMMKLPSGRMLCLPRPIVSRQVKRHRDYETGETREWETDQISYYGARQGYSGWGWIDTYSGDLFQSSVQATARDIMQHGLVNAEREGFDIFSTIHDQALGEDGDPEAFRAALCKHPVWLPSSFPLAAESGRVEYYSKD